VLSDTVASIEAIEGQTPPIDDPGFDDPNIYRMLQQGDAVGTFQTESRAQLQMAPRLKPDCFDDLVVQIAIVRPGPIQAGATNPYLRRRAGAEPITYLHPSLEPILAETLGVIIFQEQAIRIGATVAGFTPGQADMLRRTLSRSRPAEMQAMQERFLAGAARQGFDANPAQEIWQMLSRFAGYGFPKSHVVAFALTCYRSAKLRYYYPAHFYCQMLNHQPMGFYAPEVLLGDARRHGVALLPPAINQSGWRYSLERSDEKHLALRVGLCTVKAMGEQGWQRIEQARQQRTFEDLHDFCRRTRLPTDVIQSLIRAGVFDAFGERRQLLWTLGGIHYEANGLNVQEPVVEYETTPLAPELQTLWDYQVMGYSPNTHLMAHYRRRLRQAGVLSTWEVKEARAGQRVRCAGMMAVMQRPPTAKGIAFLSIEDESGMVDGVVKPDIYNRFRDVLRSEMLLFVTGIVQRSAGAVNLLIHEIYKLDAVLRESISLP
jgi:error-prone DNA polymerase